ISSESDKIIERTSFASSTDPGENFQLNFFRVDVHYLFSEKEQQDIKNRFYYAKELLTSIISNDSRCIQLWSNIVDGVYEKMSITTPNSRVIQLLFTSPITTRLTLQELIAKKTIVAFVHPDAKASSDVLDPVRTKEYAATTRLEDKALIAINPIVFDKDTLESREFYYYVKKKK
ncbi:unnamed protein product, partial [Rotaria sp. Silwood2]